MKKGFSFIEVLIVLVILCTLLAWLMPRYLQTVKKQEQTQQSVLDQARAVQGMLNERGQQQQLQLENLERAVQRGPQRTTPSRTGQRR